MDRKARATAASVFIRTLCAFLAPPIPDVGLNRRVLYDCHDSATVEHLECEHMLGKLTYLTLGIGLFATMAFGQSQIGGATLNGTVSDASASVVAGAKVTATQTETGLTRV